MSTPKMIRVCSPSSKSQNPKQTCSTQVPPDRSSLDTIVNNQKTSQMQNYNSLLIDQVKRLSRDNDRMWKLLTQTEEQHSEGNKTQKQMKQSLQYAEKQLLLMKDMYSNEKQNFEQSRTQFQNRQKEWQQVVGELKKVIQVYQSTNSIDMSRASQILNQTSEIKFTHKVDKLIKSDKQLSIYSKISGDQCRWSQINQLTLQSKVQESDIKQREYFQVEVSENCSTISRGSKKHRSKLFRSKNLMNKGNSASQSTKKICQKTYTQQMTRVQYFPSNPEDALRLLSIQDVFQRSIRKTYIKYLSSDQKAVDILQSPHMQKLRTAKSSTKQRLNKTVRKIFAFDSNQELQDVVKYIQDKVYKKYHLLKGDMIYKFLQDKFRECEQIFESSNSALERFDRQPSNFVNAVPMNSKFKQFQQKRKQMRSNDSRSLSSKSLSSKYTKLTPVDNSQGLEQTESQCSRNSSQMGLCVNSSIKDKKSLTHLNNLMKKQMQRPRQRQQRDGSLKNIYTQKRITHRNFFEQLRRSGQTIAAEGSQMNKNLSSLIDSGQQPKIYNKNPNQAKKASTYNR